MKVDQILLVASSVAGHVALGHNIDTLGSHVNRYLYSERRDDDTHDSPIQDDEEAETSTDADTSIPTSTTDAGPNCPVTTNGYYTTTPTFLTTSETSCGAACCTFSLNSNTIVTWTPVSKQPVTVGAEIVVIDTVQSVTSTTTEIVTTGIVATINSETTTLDPSLWLNNGTFDGGSNVPTRSTIFTDPYGKPQTIRYPSAYVELQTDLDWYGSLPILAGNTTSCYLNSYGRSAIPSPTFVSTPIQTADPTDPKGIFYNLGGEAGAQAPGQNSDELGECGGIYASQLLQSWRPTDVIVSVYSSCVCGGFNGIAPAQVLQTASFLLDTSTRFGRISVPTTSIASPGQSPETTNPLQTGAPTTMATQTPSPSVQPAEPQPVKTTPSQGTNQPATQPTNVVLPSTSQLPSPQQQSAESRQSSVLSQQPTNPDRTEVTSVPLRSTKSVSIPPFENPTQPFQEPGTTAKSEDTTRPQQTTGPMEAGYSSTIDSSPGPSQDSLTQPDQEPDTTVPKQSSSAMGSIPEASSVGQGSLEQSAQDTTTSQQSFMTMEPGPVSSPSTEATPALPQSGTSQQTTSDSMAMGDIIASVMGETQLPSTKSPSPTSDSQTTPAKTSGDPAAYTGSAAILIGGELSLVLATLLCLALV